MRPKFSVLRNWTAAAVCLSLACLAIASANQTPSKSKTTKATPSVAPAKEVESKTEKKSKSNTESETAIREAGQKFADDYNRHDAKSAANCFAPEAVYVTAGGTKIEGRESIEKHFSAMFAAAPKSQLRLNVESIYFVTPDVALEEGRVHFTLAPEEPEQISRYVALQVFRDGRWVLDRTRDISIEETPQTNHDRLRDLEWLVGEWMEESDDAYVVTSCRWSDDKNYLLQDFKVRIAGIPNMSGTTRIGWDPATQQFKSWTFDSDGGYSEGLWSKGKDRWTLKTRGITHLGRSYSRTAELHRVDDSTFSWQMRDRIEGGIVLPDTEPIFVTRKPPPPGDE